MFGNNDKNKDNLDTNSMPDDTSKLHKLTREEIGVEIDAMADLWCSSPRVPAKIKLPKDKRREDPLHDILDYLRVCIKYSLFERDALRREVLTLKQMVKDLGGEI